MLERKLDTRKKIELGGLLIKAGFGDGGREKTPMIFGMLLDCQRALKARPDLTEKWAIMGQELVGKLTKS
jgi:hypothetical protein